MFQIKNKDIRTSSMALMRSLASIVIFEKVNTDQDLDSWKW